MNAFEELRICQLDDVLASFQTLRKHEPPKSGWIQCIRKSLGMSLRQLAARTGMSKTGVYSAEESEARGTIQIDTLQRLAEGLECELVYCIVPPNSLQEILAEHAKEKARVLIGRVSDSMELEEQGVSAEEKRIQMEELAAELYCNRDRKFWDD